MRTRPFTLSVYLTIFALCLLSFGSLVAGAAYDTYERPGSYDEAFSSNQEFLGQEHLHFYETCGQFWPSSGGFITDASGEQYRVSLQFRLTQKDIDGLKCVSEYLEIEFHLLGFSTDPDWQDYQIDTNIPGATKDTPLHDEANEPKPALTGIRVSNLGAEFDYYAAITFNRPPSIGGDISPRVSFVWQPSYWAKTIGEQQFCATHNKTPDMCLFATNWVYLSHGYTHRAYGERQSIPFNGYTSIAFPIEGESGGALPTMEPLAPQPLPTIADSFTCNNAGIPQITDGLRYSPENPNTTTPVEFTFTITNIGCDTFRPVVLAIGGRNPQGDVTDPLQVRDFALGPGESQTFTQTAVLDMPGTHEFFMAFLRDGGGWNEIPDTSGVSQHIYIDVVASDGGESAPPIDSAPIQPASTETVPEPSQESEFLAMDIGAIGPNGHEIGAQFTVTTMDGASLGSCTLEGQGDEPYLVSCQVDVLRGTTVVVTLDTSSITPGLTPVENPMYFDTSTDPGAASHWGVTFQLVAEDGGIISQPPGQTSDIAIQTFLGGDPYYDACYILVDASLEGCDLNRDGKITFEDIPLGTYTVQQTAALPNGYVVRDFMITVTGAMQSGWEIFPAYIETASAVGPVTTQPSEQPGSIDVALITRDPENGRLLTDVCYVLVDYSNVGCDENGDGQVVFSAIPYGIYTVHQTQTPAGYPAIEDFVIYVDPTGYTNGSSDGGPLGFIVRQAPQQNAPKARNVSVVFIDAYSYERVKTGVCAEIVGASLVGCDEDLIDGQVDFVDVPAGGPYNLSVSNLPNGYTVLNGPIKVTIHSGSSSPANAMVFVLIG